MTREEFLAFEGASRDTIDVKRCYIDMAGDLVAGVLLSQIVYWHLPTREGEQKLSVEIAGEMWLAKRRTDWWDECRITPKQFDRALEVLENKGIVIAMVRRFHSDPIKHVRIDWDPFLALLKETLTGGKNVIPQRSKTLFPKQEEPISPKVNKGIDDSGNSIHAESPSQTLSETPNQKLRESPNNVNVRPEGLSTLNSHRTESIHEVIRLTGDQHSNAGFQQLYDIAHKATCDQCWVRALEITRSRISKSTQPLENPGAYFRATLTALLATEGVTVPSGTPNERKEARDTILDSLGGQHTI